MIQKQLLVNSIQEISSELEADIFLYSAAISDVNADKLINEIKQTSPKRNTEEYDDKQAGDYADSEGTEEESVDPDDGADEAFEPNVLPFEKNK